MPLTAEELVREAVQLEEDGRKFYLEAAGKSKSPQARRVFESLAADEGLHIEWIRGNLPPGAAPGTLNRELHERLRGIFGRPARAVARQAEAAADDAVALRLGIEMEERSSRAYAEWAAAAGEPRLRELFGRLVEIERFHAVVLENTLEYLSHPGDWFMQEERWSFDGG